MNRRSFLQHSILTSAGALLLPDTLLSAMSDTRVNSKKLVVIQLSGGNDSLNMVVPYTNKTYYKLRPALAIPEKDVLKLSKDQGLSPVMTSFKKLYEQGRLSIINSVGYPGPDRSHFRSMDIWQSASDSDRYLSTGWIGRYLSLLPDEQRKPHAAIEIDTNLDLALKGSTITGLSLENPDRLYDSIRRGMFRPLTKTISQKTGNPNLKYIHETMLETVSSVDYIHGKTAGHAPTRGQNYSKGRLTANLSVIAGLINANLSTRVYYTTFSGFDTHVNQKPQQARLLKELSDGVGSFVNELDESGHMNDVVILIFSEFGRRVKQNASNGTDHGCAGNILLISNNLKTKGFYNDPPDLSDLDKGDVKYKIDFRSVYAALLEKQLDMKHELILGRQFPIPDII
jgi:uncharacterized protein (DUF1501 family)